SQPPKPAHRVTAENPAAADSPSGASPADASAERTAAGSRLSADGRRGLVNKAALPCRVGRRFQQPSQAVPGGGHGRSVAGQVGPFEHVRTQVIKLIAGRGSAVVDDVLPAVPDD